MGVISASNNMSFKSAQVVFSKVRRFLKSFDAAGLLDEGEFPTYVKEVLKGLGIGVYRESQALLKVCGKKTKLPDDFAYLHVAYKCTPKDGSASGTTKHPQSSSFAFVTDVTDSFIQKNGSCEITCCANTSQVIESINVQTYVVEEKADTFSFGNIVPLRLSPNVSPSDCTEECFANPLNKSPYEISIKDGFIYTNFDDEFVYMLYYGFPIDEDGEILIPDVEEVEKLIEWHIIYQVLLSAWFDNSIPDIQMRMQKAEMECDKWTAKAKYWLKLPYFSEMVNNIRQQRSQNKLVFLTNQYSNGNFQRSR